MLPTSWTSYIEVGTPASLIIDPSDPALGAPTGLSLADTVTVNADGTINAGVAAAWTDMSAQPSFSHYEVQYQINAGGYRGQVATTNSWSLGNLKVNDTVSVKLRSVTRLGSYSAFSSVVTIGVTGTSATPNAPTGLVTTAGFRVVGLQWTNPVSTPDLYYTEIYRSGTNDVTTAVLTATTSGTAFSDTSTLQLRRLIITGSKPSILLV